jgi:hypothetical protein
VRGYRSASLASIKEPPLLRIERALELERGGDLAWTLLRGAARRPLQALIASSEDPDRAREERLAAVLAAMGGAAFAREHGLARVRSLAELRAAVPVRTAEQLRPWLDRIERGEPRVLTSTPVRCLVQTSGSAGLPKRLPVTEPWAATVRELQALWTLGWLRARPELSRGPTLTVVSGGVVGRSAGGFRS